MNSPEPEVTGLLADAASECYSGTAACLWQPNARDAAQRSRPGVDLRIT